MAEFANVSRFLEDAASSAPQAIAVRAPTGKVSSGVIPYHELSFEALNLWASSATQLFAEQGIQRGDRVLLMVRPGLELIACVFALFRLGAPPVVIDPGMGLRGFLSCVRQSKPDALVGIPLAHAVSKVFRPSFASVKSRVVVGKNFQKRLKLFDGKSVSTAQTASDELAAILFTSGSTGPAKGVCYEHGMFEAQVSMIREQYGICSGEVDLPMLPIFALFNPALGMTTIVPQMNPSRPASVDPARIVMAIEQNQVTNSFGSPVLWSKVVAYCEEEKKLLPSIRRVLMAGAPASPELIDRLKTLIPNGEVHTPYGATEVLPVSSICGSEILKETAEKTRNGSGTCVGGLLPGVEAKILPISDEPIQKIDDSHGLPQGTIGEIVVTGPSVTKTYDKLPGATIKAKVVDKNGRIWHRMGDLGYFDESERLWFCGRSAERVETEAGLLFTDRVEAIFNQHPTVFRTALVGLGDRPKQRPVLAVEVYRQHWPLSDETRKQLTYDLLELGKTHEISDFRFVKRFPVDVRHNAKIHRLSLKRGFEG
ncbi:fatty acid CoA ligase family protein [Rubellicoccus peritrichatus]|uniref:Fatty acid CoA ligase family protein n=1 Tax=Rubellicoccus peritrichatus TaxID=3080537 RepID=A0AAQ3L8N6_9BACT|nr:fatty acid CoA ligase family protein [Puniceicoccus sp. CR14]WOO39325.1 fatty acid CoA ligase family protein [Puniceicoccus sp. CR14]